MNEMALNHLTNDVRGRPESLAAPSASVASGDDLAQRLLGEMRRDMSQQIDWHVQQQLAVRRGPSLGEATLALGSLAVGALVTGILANDATTVTSGLFGQQNTSHLNTLPFIVIVWAALIAINLVWARRR